MLSIQNSGWMTKAGLTRFRFDNCLGFLVSLKSVINSIPTKYWVLDSKYLDFLLGPRMVCRLLFPFSQNHENDRSEC